MSKNLVIGILAVLLVLGSLWGQVGHKTKNAILREQNNAVEHLTEVKVEDAKTHDTLLAKTAAVQKSLQIKEQLLAKARNELIRLRKANKALESKASERDAAVAALTQEKKSLLAEVNKLKKAPAAPAAAAGVDEKQVAKLTASLKEKEQQVVELQNELKKKEKQIAQLKSATKNVSDPKLQAAFKMKAQQVAKLQATRQKVEQQLSELREGIKQKAQLISEQHAALQEKSQQITQLEAALEKKDQQLSAAAEAIEQTRAMKKELSSSAEQEAQNTEELQARLNKTEAAVQELQEQLAVAESIVEQSKNAREFASLRAQLIGLEKIVEEKTATIEETSKELDHWKVNMDVLLNRIAEQQDTMQELQEENRSLVKELTVKNKEIADLNEQLIQTPVQR
jgi:protein HOOK1